MNTVPCGRNMGHGSSCTTDYLCDGCKRIAELEAQYDFAVWKLNKAEAQVDAVREVRRLLATQCTNSHAVELLDKALQEQGDG